VFETEAFVKSPRIEKTYKGLFVLQEWLFIFIIIQKFTSPRLCNSLCFLYQASPPETAKITNKRMKASRGIPTPNPTANPTIREVLLPPSPDEELP